MILRTVLRTLTPPLFRPRGEDDQAVIAAARLARSDRIAVELATITEAIEAELRRYEEREGSA